MSQKMSQVDKIFDSSKMLAQGILDDPRNTDNAWVEARIMHCHDSTGVLDSFTLPVRKEVETAMSPWLMLGFIPGQVHVDYCVRKSAI